MSDKNCNCKAHGCPMPGAMTHSTLGGDWYCWMHFGKPATKWQEITVELNRMKFMVDAIQAIRQHCLTPEWPDIYRKIKQEILLNQRADLLNSSGESAHEWAVRLDKELAAICFGKADASYQTTLPKMGPVTDPGASDTWKRTQFDVPEHA